MRIESGLSICLFHRMIFFISSSFLIGIPFPTVKVLQHTLHWWHYYNTQTRAEWIKQQLTAVLSSLAWGVMAPLVFLMPLLICLSVDSQHHQDSCAGFCRLETPSPFHHPWSDDFYTRYIEDNTQSIITLWVYWYALLLAFLPQISLHPWPSVVTSQLNPSEIEFLLLYSLERKI